MSTFILQLNVTLDVIFMQYIVENTIWYLFLHLKPYCIPEIPLPLNVTLLYRDVNLPKTIIFLYYILEEPQNSCFSWHKIKNVTHKNICLNKKNNAI